jgi:hypothetical protein
MPLQSFPQSLTHSRTDVLVEDCGGEGEVEAGVALDNVLGRREVAALELLGNVQQTLRPLLVV